MLVGGGLAAAALGSTGAANAVLGASTGATTSAPPVVTTVITTVVVTTTVPATTATTSTTTTAPSGGPVATEAPTVSGVLRRGSKLAGGTGTWTGSGTIAYKRQWFRCDPGGAHCTSIHGATGAGYTLVDKDVGRTIGLTVRATDTTGTATAYASLAGPIASSTSRVAATSQPKVAGAAVVGHAVTVDNGTWQPTPSSYVYAWQRCNENGRVCTPIPGTNTRTYTPSADDVGHALVALVGATGGSGSQVVYSLATIPVRAVTGPVATAPPTVSGFSREGQKLTGRPGSWSGSGAIRYAFQWFRCDATGAHCSSVHGATGASYTLVARDVGKTLGLTVRATDATGTTTAYASLAGPVAAATAGLASSIQPTVSGRAAVGSKLIVSKGTWTTTPAAYTYAWQRCNENGRVCTPIPGATTSSYTVAAADAGHALLARVTARAGSQSQAAFSTAVAVPSPS
jgi:hypothetical protein